jgi:hypothetical protein
MGEPPTAADTAAPPAEQHEARGGQHEARGGRHARNAPRREQPPASVTRIDEARPRQERKPVARERPRQESAETEEQALSHLPAFLLRPVRVKA